jgi:hypothetical protein
VAPGADRDAVLAASALAAAPVVVLALWWGRRVGRTTAVAAPTVAVPAALAVAFSLLWMVPAWLLPGDSTADTLRSVGPATGVWWAALTAVAVAAGRLRARGRARTATLVAVVGAFVALELSTIADVLATVDAATAPRQLVALWCWYPSAVTGIGLGPVPDRGGVIVDAVGVTPAILTLCTIFALRLTSAHVDRRRAVPPEPSADAAR